MYTSAGIPGTGLYAVHHVHGAFEEHPSVAGNASGCVVGLLVGIALFIALMVVVAVWQQ
jgi:hypothetical protein